MNFRRLSSLTLWILSTLVAAAPLRADDTSNIPADARFATVNGKVLSAAEFDLAAREAYRQKFYHGKPPESEVNRLLRETGQEFIDKILLGEEIERKKIAPDKAAVARELAGYEARYGNSPAWAAQREQALPRLREHLETKSRFTVLEQTVRNVSPSATQIREYYDKNPALFTEPEKVRLSLILLRVDPSSTNAVWEKADQAAADIKKELVGGADFAAMAKQFSDDRSGPSGGDLGYLHRGMLSDTVEAEIDQMKIGDLGGPTRTLEGYVIFRLTDRTKPVLREFADVEGRARDLLTRELSNAAWKSYLADLRSKAKVEIGPAFQQIMSPPPETSATSAKP